MASAEAEEESYEQPKWLVSEEELLESAEMDLTKNQWSDEVTEIEESYFNFTRKPYYINKLKFINQLISRLPKSRTCVFAPTGCMKSTMSVALEKFFSFHISIDERNNLRDLFVDAVGKEQYNSHAHQYTVFRFSFETLKLTDENSVEDITRYIYRHFEVFVNKLGYNLSKTMKKEFRDYCDHKNYDVLHLFLSWLKDQDKRSIVLIFDEIDFPLTWLVSRSTDKTKIGRLWDDYSRVLDTVTPCCTLVPIAVVFGIHPIREVLSSKSWRVLKVTDVQFANYFMFTRTEVTNIITQYQRNDELKNRSPDELLNEITECYGRYAFEMYCPASVVRYLENNGSRRLYKILRRTVDITAINIPRIRAFLFAFFFVKDENDKNELVKVRVTPTKDLRRVNIRSVAIANYIFAGLLQPELPWIPDRNNYTEFKEDSYYVSLRNLENRNIVGFFLESVLSLSSSAEEKSIELTTALLRFDFDTFSEILNTFFRGLDQIELTRERDFHNPIHAYLYALLDGDTWTTESEYSRRTGNKVSGKSGRIDVRLKNKEVGYLYVFEIKYSDLESEAVINRLKNEAFAQVKNKGYISKEDVEKFRHIVVVALVCVNKIIKVFANTDRRCFMEGKTATTDTAMLQPESSATASTDVDSVLITTNQPSTSNTATSDGSSIVTRSGSRNKK